jgi:hypothetical protein
VRAGGDDDSGVPRPQPLGAELLPERIGERRGVDADKRQAGISVSRDDPPGPEPAPAAHEDRASVVGEDPGDRAVSGEKVRPAALAPGDERGPPRTAGPLQLEHALLSARRERAHGQRLARHDASADRRRRRERSRFDGIRRGRDLDDAPADEERCGVDACGRERCQVETPTARTGRDADRHARPPFPPWP